MRYLASPAQLRASLLRWSLFTVPLVLGLGFLSGVVAGSGPDNPWFNALAKPPIYPPPAAFGIVWSILYVLMGFALAMVIAARGAPGRGVAIAAFVVQLALNLAWSPLFFAMHQLHAALYLLVALDVAVLLTVALFWRVRPLAMALLLPYLAWILFATALNWEFVRLNPDADGQRGSGAAVRVQL
jgi:tryptophan-rich sensory protein